MQIFATCTFEKSDVHSDNLHLRLIWEIHSEVLSEIFRILGFSLESAGAGPRLEAVARAVRAMETPEPFPMQRIAD